MKTLSVLAFLTLEPHLNLRSGRWSSENHQVMIGAVVTTMCAYYGTQGLWMRHSHGWCHGCDVSPWQVTMTEKKTRFQMISYVQQKGKNVQIC